MKIFNALLVLAFCNVVVASDIDTSPEQQDQEHMAFRGLYVHKIIDGVTHIDPVQSEQIVHPPLHHAPPPPLVLFHPLPYGHYIHPPFHYGPPPPPIFMPYQMLAPCMLFYPWPAPMFHQPMLPPPQYFGPPPPPYKEDDQQSDDFRDEGYTSDREEEEFQQSEGDGYTSGQETVVDDGSIDDLLKEHNFNKILSDIDELCGESDKERSVLAKEFLVATCDSPTSWESDS